MTDSASAGSVYAVWLALKVKVVEPTPQSLGKNELIVSLMARLIL